MDYGSGWGTGDELLELLDADIEEESTKEFSVSSETNRNVTELDRSILDLEIGRAIMSRNQEDLTRALFFGDQNGFPKETVTIFITAQDLSL